MGGWGVRGVGIVWNKVARNLMANHIQSSGVNSLTMLPGIRKLLHLLYLYSCMGLPPYIPYLLLRSGWGMMVCVVISCEYYTMIQTYVA